MAYQDNNQGQRPPLVDVTAHGITCSECGTAIDKLPFEPTKREDGTFGKLFCYDCNKKRRRDRGPRRDFGGSRY